MYQIRLSTKVIKHKVLRHSPAKHYVISRCK